MDNLTGQRFGRWLVLEGYRKTKSGYKWKCRCECGVERFVLARNLKSGVSQSCGCLNREKVRALGSHLQGQTFGDLTVLEQAEHVSGKSLRWKCKCVCGNECVVTSSRLLTGKKTHCGCKTRKDHTKQDITGQKFKMLTALYETDRRSHNGSVIWHCRCDCRYEVDVSYDNLKYSSLISCGCRKKEVSQKLNSYLTHVAGTSVDMLKSKKIRANQTGVTGVYLSHGKYRAEIQFQGVTYRLGTYTKLETAAYVRGQAKQLLHNDFLRFYEKWKEKADVDPDWAEENPISVAVNKTESGGFEVSMLPKLD